MPFAILAKHLAIAACATPARVIYLQLARRLAGSPARSEQQSSLAGRTELSGELGRGQIRSEFSFN